MNEFLNLNRQKIVYWTKVSFFVIGLLSFIFSFIVTLNNDLSNGLESLFFIQLFGITFFILIIPFSIFIDYFFVFKRRIDFLSREDLQEFFNQNQFTKTIINSENKFKLSYYEMQGCIGDYSVRTDTSSQKQNILFFIFNVDIIPIGTERYNSLAEIFKKSGAFFEFEGIFVEIDLNKNGSFELITRTLYAFEEVLKNEKIKPFS